MHGRRWHSLARGLLANGEKGAVVASIFGVTAARISQIKTQHERRVASAPSWVPDHMKEDFALVAEERGKGVAITWANEMLRRSA